MNQGKLQIPQCLTGNALKMIAVITMLIDHFAAGIIGPMMDTHYMALGNDGVYEVGMQCYDIMRQIGRIAFPIYCFLLVEGFLHTHNRKKYALQMLFFAFVSEMPFDLLFYSNYSTLAGTWPIYNGATNVYFTLFFGLLTIWGIAYCEQLPKSNLPLEKLGHGVMQIGCLLLGALAAYYCRTDYDVAGICIITCLYLLRENRWQQAFFGNAIVCLFGFWEPTYLIAFLLLCLYNGQRGNWHINKYVFYWLYPCHLLLYYGLYILLS